MEIPANPINAMASNPAHIRAMGTPRMGRELQRESAARVCGKNYKCKRETYSRRHGIDKRLGQIEVLLHNQYGSTRAPRSWWL